MLEHALTSSFVTSTRESPMERGFSRRYPYSLIQRELREKKVYMEEWNGIEVKKSGLKRRITSRVRFRPGNPLFEALHHPPS